MWLVTLIGDLYEFQSGARTLTTLVVRRPRRSGPADGIRRPWNLMSTVVSRTMNPPFLRYVAVRTVSHPQPHDVI